MKKSLILTTIFGMLLSRQTWGGENYLVVFGGGGEPKNSTKTIFENTIVETGKFLKSSNWKSAISFNGGHSETEAALNENFKEAKVKTSFSKNNYLNLVNYYEEKIKKGEIKSGDQLMIMIDTHGAAKNPDVAEQTHNIAVGMGPAKTNLSTLEGTPLISLDTLKNLTTLAEAKGIKLAIMDFSCHSGNTLNLANKNTCVISSTGPKHLAYTDFVDNFVTNMKAGKSAEEVFLTARRESSDKSFPMISSEEGKVINNSFYPLITPYLYYYKQEEQVDKLADYLISSATEKGRCERKNQYDALFSQLEAFRSVAALNAERNFPEIAQIKALLADYKSKQDRYIDLLREWGIPELSNKETFVGTATGQFAKGGIDQKQSETMTGNYTWKELLETNFDKLIQNISNHKATMQDPETRVKLEASLAMHTKAREKQKEILSKYPNLKNTKQKLNEALDQFKESYEIANKIALEERKLYEKMYKKLKEEKKEPNPCRDFVF